MSDSKEIGDIIKEALKIVDKLGDLDIEDNEDIEDIEELIDKAKKLKKNRLWKLN